MSATAQRSSSAPHERPAPEIIKTWVFDSTGPRKYALQIQKASTGNPCVKFVEGVPQPDGTYRKFNIAIWSEDFQAFFTALDSLRAYIREHDIKTPPGHKYVPRPPRQPAPTSSSPF